MTPQAQMQVLATAVGAALQDRKWTLGTAESCTGGWIGKVLTDIVGSSAWFEGGLITYSNRAKHQLLNVSKEVLAERGAVNTTVVEGMVRGVLAQMRVDVAIAVSGIAGPGGGSAKKPVGTVYMAWAHRDGLLRTERCQYVGDREAVRAQTVITALEGILRLLDQAV